MTEDEMVRWYHQLNGHKFQQAPQDGEEQGSLECYSPWWSQRVGHDKVTEQQQIPTYVFFMSFMVSSLIFRSLTCLEYFCIHCEKMF